VWSEKPGWRKKYPTTFSRISLSFAIPFLIFGYLQRKKGGEVEVEISRDGWKVSFVAPDNSGDASL
jgi:hypothetical protein